LKGRGSWGTSGGAITICNNVNRIALLVYTFSLILGRANDANYRIMQSTYYFGNLTKQIKTFAYPRTGSHYFTYCLTGLFDLIALPNGYLHNQEAIERQNELNPDVLYALGLRESGALLQPVHFDPLSNGTHGLSTESESQIVVLIRDPIATAYSRYRVERDRWGGVTELTADWMRDELVHYADFYDHAFAVLARQQNRGLLLRWEDLVAGPQALERLATFVGVVPKLRPAFVWSLMRFENFVRPGNRTFYRSGRNEAWTADTTWRSVLSSMRDLSFERFGYTSVANYLQTAMHCTPDHDSGLPALAIAPVGYADKGKHADDLCLIQQ
jgi:hypothetical protein